MTTWTGQLPPTAGALRAMFARQSTGAPEVTPSERILYTVCEIWAAVASRTLASRLGPDPGPALISATAAFAVIGARRVVSALVQASGECSAAATVGLRRGRIAALEDRLACTEDPVDLLIAGFAARCRGPRPTGIAAASGGRPGPARSVEHGRRARGSATASPAPPSRARHQRPTS